MKAINKPISTGYAVIRTANTIKYIATVNVKGAAKHGINKIIGRTAASRIFR